MKSAESSQLNEEGTNYDDTKYEKAINTVDIAIFRISEKNLQVLLVKRKHPPFRGKWVLPGGFVDIEKKETLEESALRELKEETHATGIPIRQLGTYGDPKRDPRSRVITTVYYAFLSEDKMDEQNIKADDDAAEYKWAPVYGNVTLKLGFDHNLIMRDMLAKIKTDINSTPIAFEFLSNLFTWKELQDVYEAILGHELIAPNFRRKIENQYIISESNKSVPIIKGRFPKLLEFKGVNNIFS
jgi:8-oxo-dGTP diphosphatase